ncbi:hypothetical protein NE237_015674 [Protea cynaroides]|uniref:Uncharacterized protein n=1 Tax=Protea cynaroides TaxID=273540 RepID=A0A9Q0KE76_9MAGN|nr:hypothetical protein NE237_015674 [Protea cynaroides]
MWCYSGFLKWFIVAKSRCCSSSSACAVKIEAIRDGFSWLVVKACLGFLLFLIVKPFFIQAANGASSTPDWASTIILDDKMALLTSSYCVRLVFLPRALNLKAPCLSRGA